MENVRVNSKNNTELIFLFSLRILFFRKITANFIVFNFFSPFSARKKGEKTPTEYLFGRRSGGSLSTRIFVLHNCSLVDGVHTAIAVLHFEFGQIFSGVDEVRLFHAFAQVPVYVGPFRVHKVEMVVQSGPGFRYGGVIRQHAKRLVSPAYFAFGYHLRRLIINSHLKARRAPINEFY